MWQILNVYRLSVRKPKGTKLPWRTKHMWGEHRKWCHRKRVQGYGCGTIQLIIKLRGRRMWIGQWIYLFCEMRGIYWLDEQLWAFQELCSIETVDEITKVSLLMQIQLATNYPCRTRFSICSCRLCQLVSASHIIVLMEDIQVHSTWDLTFSRQH